MIDSTEVNENRRNYQKNTELLLGIGGADDDGVQLEFVFRLFLSFVRLTNLLLHNNQNAEFRNLKDIEADRLLKVLPADRGNSR